MPNISAIREDKLLSNLSVKYRNMEFIADEMFGMVPVKKNSDKYRIYERNFRLPETSRAMGAESNSHTFDVSTATYILERHSLHDPVPDPLADNYDIGDLRADTTEELTDTILRRREKSFLDLFTTTNWSLNTSLSAANAWNANTTTSNPILAVDTATSQVLLNSGQRANVGLIAHNALESLKNHVSVLDRVKHVSADVSEVMLAGLFGIEKLKVSAAGIDTSAKGATSSLSFMLGDVFWTGNMKSRPGLKTRTAGVIFNKAKPLVKRWRKEEKESEIIEVNMEYQVKIISSLSGFLIKDII